MELSPILPFHASFALDLIVLAMTVIVPLLIVSVVLVKRRAYTSHKRLQMGLVTLLAVVVILFEVEMRRFGWEHLIEKSRDLETSIRVLRVHLIFAVSTALIWIWTVAHALRRFPVPPRASPASVLHKRLGWLGVIGMLCTALTGWTFYWFTFIA